MTLTEEQQVAMAEKAAAFLQGTCKDLSNLADAFDDEAYEGCENLSVFCAHLDSLIFCCETCAWWCEHSEMSEDYEWVCQDCEMNDE